MSKYAQSTYVVKNKEKYVGRKSPFYRSSWECTFMVPYRNPFTGKNTIYVPDFMIVYVDRNGQKHAEVIEVKPTKEIAMENARSVRDRAAVALNMAKWAAAKEFCKNYGMRFRVVTEQDIFQNASGRR